jgi:branched-subunit amino acid aminotransferase/4-amino-4-deoxychorismate lyase
MLQKFNERNRDLIVNINGNLVHRDEAGVTPFDSAVQGGDAVWEGLRLNHGRIFALEEHLARLRSSALALAFESIPSNEQIIGEIKRTLAANNIDGRRAHIRLTLSRGVKVTSGMDPAPQPARADADRARGAQGTGVLEGGAVALHEQLPAPPRSRRARPPKSTTRTS